jgi:hypothetical protein
MSNKTFIEELDYVQGRLRPMSIRAWNMYSAAEVKITVKQGQIA